MPELRLRPAMPAIFVLSFLAGFISMSQEIVWVVWLNFISGGKPTAFANVLGFLLLGVALGSFLGGRLSSCDGRTRFEQLVWGGLVTAPLYLLSVPLCAWLISSNVVLGTGFLFLMITIVACLWGITFPLLCSAGIAEHQAAGWRVSWIYLANIAGSVFGPLLTGLILLNKMSAQSTMVWLAGGILLFAVVAWRAGCCVKRGSNKRLWLAAICATAVSAAVVVEDENLLTRLQWQEEFHAGRSLSWEVQNRHGIITVEPDKTDILYSGGTYDGRYNVDPVLDSNGIRRAFMLASLHDHPQQVLMIGLGSGSWARVVADHADVEALDVVEINPGYLELLKEYSSVESLLSDPKVVITIDDGRRWLRRNPQKDYDVIIMNSTFHWRNYMTYLLSREFFELCKKHLKDEGVLYFNTTFSKDVVRTVADNFRYVTTVGNFAAASDSPFNLSRNQRYRNLLKFKKAGGPILDPAEPQTRRVLLEMAEMPLLDMQHVLRSEPGMMVITDDNLATEYKTDRRWYNADWRWVKFWRRLRTTVRPDRK